MARSLIPAGVLADMQGIMVESMVWDATIVRTGQRVPCQVVTETSTERVAGVPLLIATRRHSLTVPAVVPPTYPNAGSPVDVRVGDHLTAANPTTNTSEGTFLPLIVDRPGPYELVFHCTAVRASTTIVAALVRFERVVDGGTSLGIPGTAGTVPAVFYPARMDAELSEVAAHFEYGVIWDTGYAYPDGSQPRTNDRIIHPSLPGGGAQLKYVRQTFGQTGPLSAYIVPVAD